MPSEHENLFRPALPTDLAAILHVEQTCFEPGIVESPEVFAARLETFRRGFFVLCQGSGVIGYVCGELWRDFSLGRPEQFELGHDMGLWHRDDGGLLYVSSLALLPENRGKGIGRAFFRQFVAAMRQQFSAVNQVVLAVNEHWPALHLYQQEGFVERGRLPAFFRPAKGPVGDAVVMTRVD